MPALEELQQELELLRKTARKISTLERQIGATDSFPKRRLLRTELKAELQRGIETSQSLLLRAQPSEDLFEFELDDVADNQSEDDQAYADIRTLARALNKEFYTKYSPPAQTQSPSQDQNARRSVSEPTKRPQAKPVECGQLFSHHSHPRHDADDSSCEFAATLMRS